MTGTVRARVLELDQEAGYSRLELIDEPYAGERITCCWDPLAGRQDCAVGDVVDLHRVTPPPADELH